MNSRKLTDAPPVGTTFGPLLIMLLCFTCAQVSAGQLCGNAMLDITEDCDDGNNDDGDGCSRTCEIENGWLCTDPYINIDENGSIQDSGFEFGPGQSWENDSQFEPLVCTVEECLTEPAGARNGIGWAQLGGIAEEPFRLRQQTDFDGTAQFLRFDLKHASCPSIGSNDLFTVSINERPIFTSGASDLGCFNGQLYSTNFINLVTAEGGPYTGIGPVEIGLELISFEGDFTVAVDNFVVGKLGAAPVPSICSLNPNITFYDPFEDINGELSGPDYVQKIQGEVGLTWGTTSDGICGTSQNPPGNHTGEPGDAACIDSTFLFAAAEDEDDTRLLINNVETYVCKAPVDLSFKLRSQVQLVVNYQPGPVSGQDFFGVWIGPTPFFGTIDTGAGSARLLTNNPQGLFGQSPGVSFEIDVSDLDGQPEVYVCFGYGNEGTGYAQVDTVFLVSDGCIDDFEEDKILSCNDNCSEYENPAQRDSDNDGYGNACDADIAKNASAGVQSAVRADNASGNDCLVNFQDLFEFSLAMFSDPTLQNWNPDADFTGDNKVNFLDLARFSELFLKEPGPSGTSTTCSASIS